MPKKRKGLRALPIRAALLLAAGAIALFVAGEAWKLTRSDAGRVLLAARFGLGDPARVTQIVGREIRRGLLAAGVSPDSIRESVGAGDGVVRWHVGLASQASLIQTNYAVTECVTAAGAEVLAGFERALAHGETVVTLRVGLPHRPLHEVRLVRSPRDARSSARAGARLALVLYGFTDAAEIAGPAFALSVPFATAIAPATPSSARLFHAAAARQREIVLHLPLEPLHYPQVDPGPGAVLVTMSEPRIGGLMRRHLAQSGPVVAVANHMGSLATQDMAVTSAVFRELKRRGLPFLHVQPTSGALCKSLAASLGVIYAESDEVLDVPPGSGAARELDHRWNRALVSARARGTYVVMMRLSPALLAWLPGATTPRRLEGVSLVPLSSVLRRPLGP
jgi:polysaccharide deacetylase 2 family uncharacterized protein YibQ